MNPTCPEASRPGIRAESGESRSSPDRKLRTPEVNKSRDVSLSHPTPDFSAVKPKVRLPKGDYKPPVSRRPSRRTSMSLSTMYMSTADIVREVLLNTADGPPDTSDPNSNEDFRSREEAVTLVEQLQENHNRLLVKYAEANNTIDCLRLTAKVNLFSEPPRPGHLVQSGLSQDASRVMTLNFPRAQRVEINPGSLRPEGHRAPPGPCVGDQLVKILNTQTGDFLQQLQNYENLLKRKKLQPSEQMKGLSQLQEGLHSLERGFLFARDEHRLLQQRGEDVGHFDHEQEVEGLIFQCGLRLEKLKEQHTPQERPACEAPPSPPPQPTPPPGSSEGGGTLSLPQSSPVPLLVDGGRAAEPEVSPATEESDEEEEEETDDEETLKSLYFKPLSGTPRRAEESDHYGSFLELPRTLEHNLGEEAFLSAALRSRELPGDVETERQRIVNMDERMRLVSSQPSSRSSPSSHPASGPSASPGGHRGLDRERFPSSSLSSLGETPSERRKSKLQHGRSRTLRSQDGVISPETDSGFIGSESCRLTPAAGSSPLHQGASQGDSVHQDGDTRTPQTVSGSSPPSSRSRGASQAPGPRRKSRGRQRRRNYSSSPSSSCCLSPQRRVSETERTGCLPAERDSSETRPEDRHGDRSSTSAPPPRPNPPRALGSRVVVDRSEFLTLEDQVSRLEEKMHHLWNQETLSPERAPPSPPPAPLYTSTPHVRPEERCQSHVSRRRREGRTADEGGECTPRGTARERAPPVDGPQRDICSDLEPFSRQPQPRTPRPTEASSAAPGSCCCCSHTVQSSGQRPRQRPAASVQVSNPADEPDLGNLPPPVLCVKCPSSHRRRSARPAGGSRESTPPSSPSSSPCSHHCPLCGCLQPTRGTKTERHGDSAPRTSCQSPESPDRTARRSYHVAPPAPLRCVLVGPPLLISSQPVHVSPRNSPGPPSGVRGHKEARGRMSSSRSVDVQSSQDVSQDVSLDVSLDKAIRAARDMKQTTRHMARSLATGLQYQERLARVALQKLV